MNSRHPRDIFTIPVLTFLCILNLVSWHVLFLPANNFNDTVRIYYVRPSSPVDVYPPYWQQVVSRAGDPATRAQQFIQDALPYALEVETRYGVPARIILAQAGVESTWGSAPLARKANNYFGVKYQGKGNPFYVDGIAYQRFASIQASFLQQGHMLTAKEHGYQPALKYKDNVYRYVQSIQRLGYCTNARYAQLISNIVSDFFPEEK